MLLASKEGGEEAISANEETENHTLLYVRSKDGISLR